MMESLVLGVSASELFRKLQKQDEAIDAREIGFILMEEFSEISPAASLSIRKWASRLSEKDFPDEQLDGLITHYLRSSGYID